jgi:hypothetical protein
VAKRLISVLFKFWEGLSHLGCGDAFKGQPGGEGGEEPVEDVKDEAVKVNDILDAFHYNETSFTKADYTTYIKGYMKKVKEHLAKNNPSRVDPFMKGAQEMVKWILSNFDKFTFYAPESWDVENTVILSYTKTEGDECPTFVYFTDGFKQVKM